MTALIPSTLDARDPVQDGRPRPGIHRGLVDGPLAMDNAVDPGAARTKGLTGLVAGRADILVAPNMEAGNMIARSDLPRPCPRRGIVMGAQVPVILTSRADDDKGAARLLRGGRP